MKDFLNINRKNKIERKYRKYVRSSRLESCRIYKYQISFK